MVLQSALDLLFKELWEIIFHYRNALFNSVWHYLDSSNHPNTYHIQKRWTSNCTPLNGKLVTIGPRNVTSNRAPLDLGPRRCCWSWASWWSRPPSDTQRAGWIERDFFQQVGDDIPLSSRSHAAIGIQSNVLGITSTVAWVWSHSWHSKGWTGHCWNILTLILKSQFDELTSYLLYYRMLQQLTNFFPGQISEMTIRCCCCCCCCCCWKNDDTDTTHVWSPYY